MIRTVPVLAALSLAVGMATEVRPGYLAAGRLAPLRFAAAPTTGRFVLPPLPANPASPNIPIPTNAATACTSETTVASSPEHSGDDLVPVTNEVAVTPQMLVGYYRDRIGGTNRDAGAVVPFGFAPPMTPPQQSSTARYSSP